MYLRSSILPESESFGVKRFDVFSSLPPAQLFALTIQPISLGPADSGPYYAE